MLYLNLATEALKQAQKENTDNITERSWEIYLRITRGAPACSKQEYLYLTQKLVQFSLNPKD